MAIRTARFAGDFSTFKTAINFSSTPAALRIARLSLA
jgi:hypothetical protein